MDRRYSSEQVIERLNELGFKLVTEFQYWETRKTYSEFEELESDITNRTGRSILHELTDDELMELVKFMKHHLKYHSKIEEKDRWTVWISEKL